MSCRKTRRFLAGYLDEALGASVRDRVREHLEECPACRAELEIFRRLSLHLARLESVAPPADSAMQIRVRASQLQSWRVISARIRGRMRLLFENILEPLAVPATGGVLTAVIVFALVVQSLTMGMPLGAVPHDLQTNLIQPARLESLAPFSITGIGHSYSAGVLIIETTVNAEGQAVNYNILAGPTDVAARRQIDQVLLFSKFRPQMTFGRPTPGGRVLLNFSEIRVRG